MEFFKRTKAKKSVCIHSRNLISLVDLTPKDEAYSFYNNHIKTCEICAKEYKKISEKVIASQVYIPKPVMELDMKESFEREIHELLVNLKINHDEYKRNKAVSLVTRIDQFGLAFIKSLNSKAFFIALALSALAYYFLK